MSFLLAGIALLGLWGGGALALGAAGLRDPLAPTNPGAELASGVSLLAVLGMTTVALGGRVSLLSFYAFVASLAAWRLVRGSRPSWPSPPRLPTDRRAGALLVACGILLLVLGAAATQDRLLWDGWAFWTFKAKVLFLEGTLPASLLDSAGPYPWTQPSYPLALPLSQWWVYEHAGGAVPALASFAGAFFLLFVPLLLWRGLRHRSGPLWAAAAALGSAAFWPMTKLAIGGYAETLMTLAMLGAVLELADGLHEGRAGSTGRYATFLALGAVAKNEGLALAIMGLVVGTISMRRGQRSRTRNLLWLTLPLVAIAPWFIFTRMGGADAPHLGELPAFAEVVRRVPTIVTAFADLLTTHSWIPLPLLLGSALLARRAHGDREAGCAWALVLGYLGMTQAVYLITPLDLQWLLGTSLERIVGTMVPALVLLSIRELSRLREGGAMARRAPRQEAARP